MSTHIPNHSFLFNIKKFVLSIKGAITFYMLWSFFWMLTPVGINYDVTDTIQYISIAEKWRHGDLSNAINGYWGPLISWLLIPFLVFISDALLAFKILQIFIGAFVLLVLNRLIRNLGLSMTLHVFLNFLFAILISTYALQNSTPDLLLVLLFILYLNNLLFKPKQHLQHGLLGGLMFLCKSYALPFFLIHILIFYMLRSFQGQKEVKNFFKMMTVFLLISASWIILLTNKYGELTISKSGTYNMSLQGPELWNPERKMHPTIFEGLFPPANETASSAWEDPSLYPIKKWNPLSTAYDRDHYLFIIKNNILSFYYGHIKRQTGVIVLLLLLIYFFYHLKKKLAINPDITFLLITAFIYTGGYMLIFPMNRYLWPVSIIMIILIFIIADEFIRFKGKWRLLGLLSIVISSLLIFKRSVKEMIFVDDKELSFVTAKAFLTNPNAELKLIYSEKLAYNDLTNQHKLNFLKHKRVASISLGDSYVHSTILAFQNEFNYYGELSDSLIQIGFADQLNTYEIDYLLMSDPVTQPGEFLSKEPKLILHDEETGLRIYDLQD